MGRKYLLSVLFIIVTTLSLSAQYVIKNGKSLYLSNSIILKAGNGITQAQLNKTLAKFSINSAQEMYPSNNIPNKIKGTDVLNGIYLVKYNTAEDPQKLADEVAKMPGVLWAEPQYVRKVCYTPSDSLFLAGDQDNLIQINALHAWDITKGNKKIIIGIVDTGVDWRHPDLLANIYMVGDSLIPGCDLGGLNGVADNDPSEDVSPNGKYHGTLCAGVAGAVTGNGIGIASVGYNCSILPVKASMGNFRDEYGTPYIIYGAAGIKWAADHGAKVINCSWGGYNYSAYEQSVIDYALAKGAVVVAAAGNDSSMENFYPADYKGVLSVGWLKTGIGVKTIDTASNYGEIPEVFAPGSDIYSTDQRPEISSPGLYRFVSGTSVSAPQVSGLAGLVMSVFPSFTPEQVEERIRVTSDYIDDYNASAYKNLLGHGLINAYRAVDKNVNAVSVRATDILFTDSVNNTVNFKPGEEVSIKMNFINYLASVNNVKVTLTANDGYVTIENGTFDTGPMDTLATVSDESNLFKFKISEDVVYNHTIHFLLKYSDGAGYNDFQWIDLKVNEISRPVYTTNKTSLIKLTVTSTGDLAFDDYPYNKEGEGFKYRNSENLMNEGAFMYGTDPLKVMDGAHITNRQSKDFTFIDPVETSTMSGMQRSYSIFSDSGAGENALGIFTVLETYTTDQTGDNNYAMLIATLYNNTSEPIYGLYAGYYIDWDIPESDPEEDTTYFDNVNKFAVAYNLKDPSVPITGAALISDDKNFGYCAIDNNAVTGNVVFNDGNGFSDKEKWYALSNGVVNSSVKTGNISYVISGGPYYIPAQKSKIVAFTIAAGSTLQEVIDAVKESRRKYNVDIEPIQKPIAYQLDQNYPNPFNPSTIIGYHLPTNCMVTLKVYDILGREVATLVNELQKGGNYKVLFSADKYRLASGVYFYRLSAGSYSFVKKMIILK